MNHFTTPRTRRIVFGALVAAAIASAGAAHADQDSYLGLLHAQGASDSPDKQQDELYLGRLVCARLAKGKDDDEVESLLRSKAAINSHEANVFVITAREELC
jgi:Protein of unknown function (DUF732)